MYSQSILPERLSTFEYYENKLPMWLKSSTTFKEHFRIWFDMMIQDISYEGVIIFFETKQNKQKKQQHTKMDALFS